MKFRGAMAWGAAALIIGAALAAAASSPLLAWRDPIYIAAGFSGVVGLALMLVQPLLAGAHGTMGLRQSTARAMHRVVGTLLVGAVVLHIAGLWVTSPPDVIDVLLFRSPTPFAIWGALAMWSVAGAALLALFRRRLHWRPRNWRIAHVTCTGAAVLGTVLHTLLIEGTMEPLSKVVLCLAVTAVSVAVFARMKV